MVRVGMGIEQGVPQASGPGRPCGGSPLAGRAASGRSGQPARAGGGRRLRPWGWQASSATSPTPWGRVTAAALRAKQAQQASPWPQGPPRRCRRRGRPGGSPAGPRRCAPPPGCPGRRTAGRPQPARQASRRHPRRPPPTAERGRGAKPKHRLGAGKGLEPGPRVRSPGPGPSSQRTSPPETLGDDHHAGEPLRTPLGEQPAVPDALLGEAGRTQGPAASPPPGAKPRPRRRAASRPTPREARYSSPASVERRS